MASRLRPFRLLRRVLHRLAGPPAPAGCGGVTLADLLGRKPVNLDTPELQRFLAGRTVLVTGAGGSIGSEICRQIMRFCPVRLILLDRAEHALFEIEQELRHRWVGAELLPCVADICDRRRIESIFAAQPPHVVFHCAAHKHVPMMEANCGEAVKNNVFGTKTIADAAAAHGVGAFVMVSTDKAVNPTSVMGATKRVAELYVQSLNARHEGTEARRHEGANARFAGDAIESSTSRTLSLLPHSVPSCLRASVPASRTRFVAVRFGNVLGSSGSVVPIFQKQIEAGGPVTVTHADMRRYFMTIPEASQLVMQAGAIGKGGEIFVLDMGEPVRIVELARELIRRNGLRPDEDILIEFTGVRPGEKLYEELAGANEHTRPTSQEKIRVWQLPRAGRKQIDAMLELLAGCIDGTPPQIVEALRRCVPEYRSPSPVGAAARSMLIGTQAEPLLRLVDAAA